MKKKVIIVANTGFTLYHFRLPLMKHLLKSGWEVVAVADEEADFGNRLLREGIRFNDVRIDHKGKNPVADISLTCRLLETYRSEKPLVVHHFTSKPVIFGSLAAKLANVPVIVNSMTGLGYGFQRNDWLKVITAGLYRMAMAGRTQVIFQNRGHYRLFVSDGFVKSTNAHLILGSGVDTRKVFPVEKKNSNSPMTFLLVARMLWGKGIEEYVQAARIVKSRYPETCFKMVGGQSGGGAKANPDSIPKAWLQKVNSEKIVNWIDTVPFGKVLELLDQADVFVLPTFLPEGIPKALIEAAAKGKAMIAADTPGCREVIKDGINGFLVPPRNPESLAAPMIRFIENREWVPRMGKASRELAVDLFDERKIFEQTVKVYDSPMQPQPSRIAGMSELGTGLVRPEFRAWLR
jgi:glycosyltransferase involved in cell wall biosynthesis